MTPGERVARANRAADLLRDLEPTFRGVEDALVRQLKTCPIKDDDLMRELVRTLQVGEQYKKHLASFIQDGKLADAEMRQEESIRRRKKVG